MGRKYDFRDYSENYLQKKQEQYNYVAHKVQKVINECGYEESEASFELAKKWLLNNENLSIIQGVGDAIRELLEYISKWLSTMVGFVLGVLTTLLSNDMEKTFIENFWGYVVFILAIGFALDLLVKTSCTRIEKLCVRIMKEMTYSQYKLLIDAEKNKKSKKQEK